MVNVSGGHLCWDRMPPNPLATARHVQPLQLPHAAKPKANQYNQIVFHQVLILPESSSCLPCSPTPTLAMEVASLLALHWKTQPKAPSPLKHGCGLNLLLPS